MRRMEGMVGVDERREKMGLVSMAESIVSKDFQIRSKQQCGLSRVPRAAKTEAKKTPLEILRRG